MAGVAWNAGIFLWRRRAIAAALGRYTGLLQTLGPMIGAPAMLDHAYESIQRAVSIDYAVMEGAARNGEVAMASMDVGWSDLGHGRRSSGRSARAATASSSRPARRSTSATTTCRPPRRRPAGRHRAARAR